MRVLLTGSQGFIGQSMFDHAVLLPTDTEFITVDKLEGADHVFDLINPFTWKSDNPIDAVFHLASESGVRNARRSIGPTNTLLARNIAQWATQNGVKLIVNASSSSVYGEQKDQVEHVGNLTPVSAYGRSKLASEAIFNTWAKDTRSTAINLRLFNVLGKGQRKNMLPYLIAKHLKDKSELTLFGYRHRNYTYAGDVVRAFGDTLRTFHNSKAGTCLAINVGTGHSIVQSELVSMFERLSGLHAFTEMGQPHPDDVSQTKADTARFTSVFGWTPSIENVTVGIREVLEDLGVPAVC